MADTQRSRSSLQTLLGDQVTGQISPQDLRDFLVTVMQPEFVNSSDYWAEPLPDQITTSLTTRGYHIYSQVVGSVSLEFGRVYALNTVNEWSTADTDSIVGNQVLGIAADSFESSVTTAVLLRKGIVYDSTTAFVNRLTGEIGNRIFLLSIAEGSGSISITNNNDSRVVGFVLPAGVGESQCKGKWHFCPDGWAVAGV